MADATRTIATEQVIADAEMVATFLRTLLAQDGMTVVIASNLASTYLSSNILARAQHEKPKDPWDKP